MTHANVLGKPALPSVLAQLVFSLIDLATVVVSP